MTDVNRSLPLLRWAAGCGATLVAIDRATSGALAVPPSGLVLSLTFTFLMILVVILGRLEPTARRGDLLAAAAVTGGVFVAGLGAGHLLLAPGVPYSHDVGTHLWGMHALFRSSDGLLPDRWVADLGAGMPLLQHYGPLAYLPGLALMGLQLPVYDAFKITLLLTLIASAATMYLAAHRVTGRRDTALLAAVAYTFAPYHLLDTHYRGALGESMALVGVPIFLEAVVSCCRGRDRGALRRLIGATIWIALSHPVTLFTAGVGAGIAAAAWWRQARGVPPLRWLGGITLGVGVSAFWLFPAVLELPSTAVGLILGGRNAPFAGHGLLMHELVSRRLWYGRLLSYGAADQPPGAPIEMPYYFGISFLAAAVALLLLSRRRAQTLRAAAQALRLEALARALNAPILSARFGPAHKAPTTETAATHLEHPPQDPVPLECAPEASTPLTPSEGSVAGQREAVVWLTLLALSLLMTLLGVTQLLEVLPGFTKIRYPWRFLGIATAAGSLVVGLLAARVGERLQSVGPRGRSIVSLTILAVLAVDFMPYTGAGDWVAPWTGTVHWYRDRSLAQIDPTFRGCAVPVPVTLEVGGGLRVEGLEFPPARPDVALAQARGTFTEYFTPRVYVWLGAPKDIRFDDAQAGITWRFTRYRGDAKPVENARTWARLEGDDGDTLPLPEVDRVGSGSRFSVTMPAGHPGGLLHLLEQAGPGWRAASGGGPWREVEADADGFMRIPIEPGTERISLRYGFSTGPRALGLAVTPMSLVVLGAMVWRGRARRVGRPGASPPG